jgi:hypothetical protein
VKRETGAWWHCDALAERLWPEMTQVDLRSGIGHAGLTVARVMTYPARSVRLIFGASTLILGRTRRTKRRPRIQQVHHGC